MTRIRVRTSNWWILGAAGVCAAITVYVLVSGGTGAAEEKASVVTRPPAQPIQPPTPAPVLPAARLAIEPLRDEEQFRGRFREEQVQLLEKLNRADQVHLLRLAAIVVPGQWDRDELDYSPLPATWPDAAAFPKALVLSQPFQVFGAYESGKLVRWGPVSSGRQSRPTPPGLFFLNWKSRGRVSTVDGGWFLKWYFNFINERGISFHEFDLPGQPESHGCVRLLGRDAEWLFYWGEQWKLDAKGWKVERPGTPVLILGKYDFGKAGPWLSAEYLAADRPVRLDAGAIPKEWLDKLRQSPPPVVADGSSNP